MARKRKRSLGEAAKLEMTPMIDVVFQLLIFFIVTLKPQDLLSKMDVARPAPDTKPPKEDQIPPLAITVFKDGYIYEGRRAELADLRSILITLAGYDRETTVTIKCTMQSQHGQLVRLLNVCEEAGLADISVFSM